MILALGLALAASGQAPAAPARASSAYTADAALARVAAVYNAQESDVLDLRAKGWSWSELGDALAVSKRAGRPLQEIVAERDAGMSWSRIAAKHGFPFQEVSRGAKRAARQARLADEQRREALKRSPPGVQPRGGLGLP